MAKPLPKGAKNVCQDIIKCPLTFLKKAFVKLLKEICNTCYKSTQIQDWFKAIIVLEGMFEFELAF